MLERQPQASEVMGQLQPLVFRDECASKAAKCKVRMKKLGFMGAFMPSTCSAPGGWAHAPPHFVPWFPFCFLMSGFPSLCHLVH